MDNAGAQGAPAPVDALTTAEDVLERCESMELNRRLAAVEPADRVIRNATAMNRRRQGRVRSPRSGYDPWHT